MIAISMRMTRQTYANGCEELRDALARNWWTFLDSALPGATVLPIPNIGEKTANILDNLPISGLILSGGDDWDVFPERDRTEKFLVYWAEARELPIIGICRGAQILNLLHGGQLSCGLAKDHVRTRHNLHSLPCQAPIPWPAAAVEVNSFHNCGIRPQELADSFVPFLAAPDGSIEGFCSRDGRIVGLMWHPERESSAQAHDINIFQALMREKA